MYFAPNLFPTSAGFSPPICLGCLQRLARGRGKSGTACQWWSSNKFWPRMQPKSIQKCYNSYSVEQIIQFHTSSICTYCSAALIWPGLLQRLARGRGKSGPAYQEWSSNKIWTKKAVNFIKNSKSYKTQGHVLPKNGFLPLQVSPYCSDQDGSKGWQRTW